VAAAAPFPSLRSGLPPQAGEDTRVLSSPACGGSVRRSLTKGASMRDASRRTTQKARALRKAMTKAEAILWTALRRESQGLRFRRQHPIGPYIADFACMSAMLIVEVDGPSHFDAEGAAKDRARTAYLEAAGWLVVRVTNTDVYENLAGVVRMIAEARPPSSASPTLPPQAGEDARALSAPAREGKGA
jgi:very-short-patch-repair endonuclease